MPYLKICEIVMHQEVADGHFRLAVNAPEIAPEAEPGQFAMIQVSDGLYPFLRRPMSFERIYPDGLSILYKVEGEGTRILSRFTVEGTVSLQGPLGRGFPLQDNFDDHILVAGGIGVAPLPALAEALTAARKGPLKVVIGAATADLILCEDDFRQMGCNVYVATEDGSRGNRGTAVDSFASLDLGLGTCVYACGPMPMLRAVADHAHKCGATCYVSLEARMACGDGACLGCTVEGGDTAGQPAGLRVCADGPVFNARYINWEAQCG